ncbi:MAG: beta-galactosidase [Polyangiaceae bacterium]|nr:beta-galactosidase [Polyangiaceae bacterium]
MRSIVTASEHSDRSAARGERGVRLVPGGLSVGGEPVPLYAGSVHYWRLDPRDWRACLEATKALGARLVDLYIPWNVHETAPGQFDFGRTDARRDVASFLRIAHEVGLYAIARPGPHINAELTYFGIPERIIWDPPCQARSRSGHPVMLPMLPFAFPVPSYASEAFHDEVARYFQALGPVIGPLLYPAGPIVLVQIDNEGALYFRDGAYDQDYHPDAIRHYRHFLREKYRSIEALRSAYSASAQGKAEGEDPGSEKSPKSGGEEGDGELRFASISPPVEFDAQTPGDLARQLDWSEFHEHLLATAFARFDKALEGAGISGLPTSHNLPPGQDATPLNAARVGRAVDLVGLDYYHEAGPRTRAVIARRTSELSVRCEGLGHPAFACEMGAGFPPFFPPLEEGDSIFTLLAALAYGLRGFNIYMAVERDRWIGAPIDPHGRARPFAAFYKKLIAGLEATNFTALRRRTPVRILIPRSERRLARVMHAFGPLAGTIFSILGGGARESCVEDDLGLGYPLAIEADTFARTFERALDARGVPFAYVGGEDRDVSLAGAKWIVCASSGGMNPALWRRLQAAAEAGARVTIGPYEPVFDGSMRPLAEPYDLTKLRPIGAEGEEAVASPGDPASADAAVARAIEILKLPAFACDPEGVFATVHEDASGQARVLFLLNPGSAEVVARVSLGEGVGAATDVLDDMRFEAIRGAFEVQMRPRSVRMLALDHGEGGERG